MSQGRAGRTARHLRAYLRLGAKGLAEFREGYALDEAAAALVPLNAVGQNETGPCGGRALS
jgi:hypothetical protein